MAALLAMSHAVRVLASWQDSGEIAHTAKQVGCFNHRVVALVADKLERQWSLEVWFDVED